MASVQKNIVCEEYYKGYINLTDTKKKTFSRLCNKLLSENFIYASKTDDRNDYYEILSMKSLIENLDIYAPLDVSTDCTYVKGTL